jgi:hypothetical protein
MFTYVKNRVLRRIFGPKREEVTGGRRKLHNEGFHNLYSSSSKIIMIKSREDEMGRAYSKHRSEEECMYEIEWKTRRKETTRKSWT